MHTAVLQTFAIATSSRLLTAESTDIKTDGGMVSTSSRSSLSIMGDLYTNITSVIASQDASLFMFAFVKDVSYDVSWMLDWERFCTF